MRWVRLPKYALHHPPLDFCLAGVFVCLCVPYACISLRMHDNIVVSVCLRTGDKAIIAGAIAIAVYEKCVRDDEDLISRRVAAYRTHRVGRVVTDAVILATALHLSSYVTPEWDIYHVAMKHLRRKAVDPQ